ncbi:MAG: hypothetical protein KJ043_21560 [Anaerolineae bacterium]|nr:hypothetical protein [Anaerolineae bacterium]
MRFTLYTEKSVSDCTKTLIERIQAKQNSKNGVRGNVNQKTHEFNLQIGCKILFLFPRSTQMNGKISKEGGQVTINGFVPDGMSPYWMLISGAVLAVVCGGFLILGENALAFLGILAGFSAYVMLRGDYRNSEALLVEIERTLKASPKPPKKK